MKVGMFESFATRHWFSSAAMRIWSDESTLQAWLDVEAALALVQAELGLVPAESARTIAAQAQAGSFDLAQLSSEIAFAQHPLVPVLHHFETLCGEPAAGFIHWGATTQNIFDTAAALQMKQSHGLLQQGLHAAVAALARLAAEHKDTPMAGRTHGQHALPMTFGFKAAGWIDELERDRARLDARLPASFPACMGGAIGSFAAMGTQGREVQARLAQHLGLEAAELPLRASYDRAADYVAALGLLAGTAQKIAQDVVFMQRTEIGEAFEAFHLGKVGSSTMAQKRNPSTALLLASLCRLLRTRVPAVLEAQVRMDEGDSSSTNVTDVLTPEIAILAVSVAETLARLAEGLMIDPAAMRRNLDSTCGLIASEAAMMKLGRAIGRHEAHRVLYDAAQQAQSSGLELATALREHPRLKGQALLAELEPALDPAAYLGASALIAEETAARVLARSPAEQG